MPAVNNFDHGYSTDIVLSASYTSPWFVSGQASKISIQAVITNVDAVGSLKVQASLDGSNAVDVPFEDDTGAIVTSLAVTSGVAVNHIFRIPEATENKYRVVYTRTSGGASNLGSFYILAKSR